MRTTSGRGRVLGLAAGLAVGLAAGCDGAATDLCSEASLRAALDTAFEGETVRVGACRVEIGATLSVPAGVVLSGVGPTSVLASSGLAEGADLLALTPGDAGAAATIVRALRIEYEGSGAAVHAFLVDGASAPPIELRDLDVRVERGVGIALRSRRALLTVDHVSVEGSLTEADVASLPSSPGADAYATVGFAAVGVGSETAPAVVTDLAVRGFAARGVAFVDGILRWDTGVVADVAGVGVQITGGDVSMSGVSTERVRPLAAGLVPAMAMAVGGGAAFDAGALSVSDTGGYGLVVLDASARLEGLNASDNDLPGVWSQQSLSLEISGAESVIARNGGVGIAALGTQRLALDGARIEGTLAIPRAIGGTVEMIGDGLHVTSGTGIDYLDGIIVADNARVGLLLDGNGAALTGTLSNITVRGSGASLGAVGQNGVAAGWDSGVTREGDVLANDAAFTGTLPVLGERLVPPNLAALDGMP